MAQISQAIVREDAIVTHDLHNIFPFWKEGFPMVQFDNAYKILQEDISLHFHAFLDAMIEYVINKNKSPDRGFYFIVEQITSY